MCPSRACDMSHLNEYHPDLEDIMRLYSYTRYIFSPAAMVEIGRKDSLGKITPSLSTEKSLLIDPTCRRSPRSRPINRHNCLNTSHFASISLSLAPAAILSAVIEWIPFLCAIWHNRPSNVNFCKFSYTECNPNIFLYSISINV